MARNSNPYQPVVATLGLPRQSVATQSLWPYDSTVVLLPVLQMRCFVDTTESENHTDNMQLAEAEISAKRTSEASSVADYATGLSQG